MKHLPVPTEILTLTNLATLAAISTVFYILQVLFNQFFIPFQVLHKWGEYSQDVQFILQRSSLDGGNKGVGPLSPPLQRSKFGPNPGGLGQPPPLQQQQQQQQQQPGQNTKARSVEPPPPAVWKPPPFTGKLVIVDCCIVLALFETQQILTVIQNTVLSTTNIFT
jgi:hypothetical protein